MTDSNQLVHEFERALLSLDRLEARKILAGLAKSTSPLEAVETLVFPALERIGKGWEEGSVALSQSYMGGRICEELVDTFLPSESTGRRNSPRMAIAVLEDHHALGKRIVYSVMRSSGFGLLDYGHGVLVDDLVERVRKDSIEVLLLSCLMLRSALMIKQLKDKMAREGLNVKIIVGGAPFLFDSHLWIEVGADAMGKSASDAVTIVTRLIEGQS